MDIKGKFGYEIINKDGHVVKSDIVDNNITVDGIKQIKAWLDREEYVSNTANRNKWRDPYLFFNEKRKISVYSGVSFDGSWDDGTDVDGPERMYDMCSESYMYFQLNQDSWDDFEVTFDKPLDICQLGMLMNMNGSDMDEEGGGQFEFSYKPEGLTVADAGTTGYNTEEFLMEVSEYNGNNYYKVEDTEYYMYMVSGQWIMSTSLGGSADYQTINTDSTDPWDATWEVVNGTSPVPTVTNGTGDWRYPYCMKNNTKQVKLEDYVDGDGRRNSFINHERYYYNSREETEDDFCGIAQYHTIRFERNITDDGYVMYGYLPKVKTFRFNSYNNDNSDGYPYLRKMEIYEPVMHPFNPFVLQLGTDDGTVLPLDYSNTSLGAPVGTAKWIVDDVSQIEGEYTVRFSKVIPPEEANDTSFNEIALMFDSTGHLPSSFNTPTLSLASSIFARSIFSESWSKTDEYSVNIFYEITVS